MMLKTFELVNFRGIKKMPLTFTRTTTALLGVNGAGKSSVLDALAIALSNMTARIAGQASKARDISPDDIRNGTDYARLQIEVDLGAEGTTSWAVARNRKSGKHPAEKSSDFEELNARARLLNTRMLYNEETHLPVNLPLAVYYDVHRAVLDVPLRVKEKVKNTPLEAYSDALGHGGTDFRSFFSWFRDREDIENEHIRDKPGYGDRDLTVVRKAIEEFTKFKELRIRRKPTLRMTVKKGDAELNVLQLSDGEKCLLAMVGDLARRLSLLNTERDNPLEGEGIVLIDEIDLHLHPKWQRTVVASLERTFPNCQFVITTHSPQVIGELPAESVMLMRDGTLLGHAERALGLSSGDVLEELMEGKARNSGVNNELLNIRRCIDQDQIQEAQKLVEQLEARVGAIPDILQARSAIQSLQWLEDGEE